RLGALLAAARDARPERLSAERLSAERPPAERLPPERPSAERPDRLFADERPLPPRRRSVEDELFDDGDEPLTLNDVRNTVRGVRR
ncbi:MAG TPA: hypothetical protein VGC92_05390, partial [Phenylobacterium sp.]